MKIEVVVAPGSTTKQKGDLLENLAKKLLTAQSYEVIQEIRFTGAEIDLLCKHKVSGREIYVECKAHRDNIDANVIKNLGGTLMFKKYDEAWLISTAELGKEAKGIVKEWQQQDDAGASKLSFYTPELVIHALVNSGTIENPPNAEAQKIVGGKNLLGEWTLTLTQYGIFWLCTKLTGGVPVEVLAFYAGNNEPVLDEILLSKLGKTDSSLAELNFVPAHQPKTTDKTSTVGQPVDVVTVQYGDSWSDYRPSRPQDFVGREKDQRAIIEFFRSVISNKTSTRVFAFTGDSGMGKSSLVAKIVDRAKNLYKGKKIFVYAVDLRAATSPAYVYSALLRCLRTAQENGFGKNNIDINITDVSSPLNSVSVKEFLLATEKSGQLIVLILDQFEELYTKPELYDIFERAKSLLLSCAALGGNFCLGFAWKSDSTTPNEHPAYFFWHALSDYRLTQRLVPFSDQDSSAALNIFEKQLGQKLHNDLRHNLLVSSQGYPWLLKKLCIHVYDKIQEGVEQKDLLENELDVGSLFDDDLKQLTGSERACLDFVAKRAPVDWFEVNETSTVETLNSLIHRRLIIKSGDRLNIYWDIFREYLLTKKVPIIPLRYLPSTDFSSVWQVVRSLSHHKWIAVSEISQLTGFSEGTVQNIGTDINMFGVAARDEGKYILGPEIDVTDAGTLARKVREKFKRHSFSISLQTWPSNTVITIHDAVELLKAMFPNSTYASNTWHVYTTRLCRWLELCGLLISVKDGWIYRDKGDAQDTGLPTRVRKHYLHIPLSSPESTIEALKWLIGFGTLPKGGKSPRGFSGALNTLVKLNLASSDEFGIHPNVGEINTFASCDDAVRKTASVEHSLIECIDILKESPTIDTKSFAMNFSNRNGLDWSTATIKRSGRPMKQWAEWLLQERRVSM